MTSEPVFFSRQLSLAELLDATFRIYRKNFKTLALTAGALLVPLELFIAILMSLMVPFQATKTQVNRLMPFWTMPQLTPAPDANNLIAVGAVAFVIGIIEAVFKAFVVIALIWLAIEYLHKRQHTVTEAWSNGKKNFWRYLLLLILESLILAIPMVLLGLGMLIPGIGIAIAIILFLVVFYISMRWFLAPVALVDRPVRSFDAIGASWGMTSAAVGRVILYVVLLMVLNFVVTSMPSYLLQMGVIALAPATYYGAAFAGISAVSSILNALWMPIYYIAMVMLYFDLRNRQEGYSLAMQVDALETNASALGQFLQQDAPDVEDEARGPEME